MTTLWSFVGHENTRKVNEADIVKKDQIKFVDRLHSGAKGKVKYLSKFSSWVILGKSIVKKIKGNPCEREGVGNLSLRYLNFKWEWMKIASMLVVQGSNLSSYRKESRFQNETPRDSIQEAVKMWVQ